jgi:hypothetical protein
MDRSSEFDFLIECLKPINRSKTEDLTKFEKINWEKWLTLTIEHGVFTQVYQRIRESRSNILPEKIHGTLKDIYYKNITRNIKLCAELKDFQTNLDSAGISSLFFKGPVLSFQAYNDYALRSFQDIDILIRSGDFNEFYNKIEKERFTIIFKMGKWIRIFWSWFGREYTFGKGTQIFDLHFRIQRGPKFRGAEKRLFKNYSEIKIEDKMITGLSPEMSIISICINVTKDGWTRLVYITDLVNLVKNQPEINWETVIRCAKKMKVYSILLITLSLSEKFLGMQIPGEINTKDLESSRIKSLCDKFSDNLQEGYIKKKKGLYQSLEIRSIDTMWGRFRYVLYYIFVPKMSDIQNIKIPGILFPLYIIFRPFFLIIRCKRSSPLNSREMTDKG